ncbi:hypothetical protein KP509_03G021600 [Ceratopteris richardii]|uniref:Uncharacterized protein n=1 Tax=Ceratopteris richardii TaxID=49495 RepID=A0A8T2V1L1_CERRI|nr:hypothetical protein KP509_03G021600 [Ceratopteris richardii]
MLHHRCAQVPLLLYPAISVPTCLHCYALLSTRRFFCLCYPLLSTCLVAAVTTLSFRRRSPFVVMLSDCHHALRPPRPCSTTAATALYDRRDRALRPPPPRSTTAATALHDRRHRAPRPPPPRSTTAATALHDGRHRAPRRPPPRSTTAATALHDGRHRAPRRPPPRSTTAATALSDRPHRAFRSSPCSCASAYVFHLVAIGL